VNLLLDEELKKMDDKVRLENYKVFRS